MAPLASDDAVEQIKARLNLVEVVQTRVRLRKQGREWVGLCPFHDEKTPSFQVNEPKQSYYCHGCQRGGDVIRFIQEVEKTDFRGALEQLADMAGIELADQSGPARERAQLRRRIGEINRLAVQYYEYVLHSTAAGEPGRALLGRRGVTEETARRFGLGYAPGGASFAGYLRNRKRTLADATAAGLVRRDGADFFDRRLVVPIRDERGQPLAFTGRTVVEGEVRKYVNSPESAAYVKGRVIFALDLARPAIEAQGHAVLMEGQFDVIVAHRHGVEHAVASSGTALTADQVTLLKRFTEEILLVFDNDPAGRAAAFKAIELAAAQQVRTRVGRLGGGAKDPDEYLRAGGSWEEVVRTAPSGWEFWIKEAVAGLNPSRPADLEVATRRVNDVLARIGDGAVRESYRQEAARWLGVDQRLLVFKPPPPRGPAGPAAGARPAGSRVLPERVAGKSLSKGVDYLLRVLAVRPDALPRVRQVLRPEDLDEDDRSAYLRMVETLDRGGLEALAREVAGFPALEESLVRGAWASPPPGVEDAVVDDVVRRIRAESLTRRRRAIIRGLAEAERLGDAAGVAAFETEWRELSERL